MPSKRRSPRAAPRTGATSPAQAQGLNPRPCLTSGASRLLFGQFPRRTREIISSGKSPRTRLPAVLSTRLRRLPGHVPMATPPSARSNARADARPPAVSQRRPMAIQGACHRLPPSPLESQSGIRRAGGVSSFPPMGPLEEDLATVPSENRASEAGRSICCPILLLD